MGLPLTGHLEMGTALATGAGKTGHRVAAWGKTSLCEGRGRIPGAQVQLCTRGGESSYQLPLEWRESVGEVVPDTQRTAAPPSELRGILSEARLEGISGLRRVSDFLLL